MKNLVLVLAVFFLISPGVVFAQDSSSTLKNRATERLKELRQTAKEQGEQKRQEATERVSEKREEKKARIAEHRAVQIKKVTANLQERLNRLIVRLEAIIARIQSRIDKFASRGADTSEAQASLGEAKAALSAAKASIAALSGIGDELVASGTPREFFAAFKDEITRIKNQLKEVHRLMANSLSLLKGLSSTAPGVEEVENE